MGEVRLARVRGDELVQMDLVRDGDGLQAGTVAMARLLKKIDTRGIVQVENEEAVLQPLPPKLTEGELLSVEVMRSAWLEPSRNRLAKVSPVRKTVEVTSFKVTRDFAGIPEFPDTIKEQWEDSHQVAEIGKVEFAGGSLTFSPTPALLAVDVDGVGQGLSDVALLTLAKYIRLWKIGGSVVVDLPEASKEVRASALQNFDRAMQDVAHERTRINGFGLLQIVLPRRGMSILERAQLDRSGTEAVRLLESAFHCDLHGRIALVARRDIIRWIESRPHLVAKLSARLGQQIDLRVRADAGSGYVEPSTS